jgi:hypothetical protein
VENQVANRRLAESVMIPTGGSRAPVTMTEM